MVEQEPRQTSAGAQVDREMRKGNVDRAMSQVDTQREFEEHLNKMMQQAMLGMKKNKNLARQVFRSWAQDLINNKEFWGS
mgnify:FL=1